jgi:hypothetical protein
LLGETCVQHGDRGEVRRFDRDIESFRNGQCNLWAEIALFNQLIHSERLRSHDPVKDYAARCLSSMRVPEFLIWHSISS